MPYNPGLGQGHGKKRHLHAQRIVSFIYNPEAKRRGHLLSSYLISAYTIPKVSYFLLSFSFLAFWPLLKR